MPQVASQSLGFHRVAPHLAVQPTTSRSRHLCRRLDRVCALEPPYGKGLVRRRESLAFARAPEPSGPGLTVLRRPRWCGTGTTPALRLRRGGLKSPRLVMRYISVAAGRASPIAIRDGSCRETRARRIRSLTTMNATSKPGLAMEPSLFLSSLLAIVLIDIVLAGDNAIVIALAARQLPAHLQRRAIAWGAVGAVGVRIVLTAAVVWLLQIPGLLAVGGALLVWIAWKLLIPEESAADRSARAGRHWFLERDAHGDRGRCADGPGQRAGGGRRLARQLVAGGAGPGDQRADRDVGQHDCAQDRRALAGCGVPGRGRAGVDRRA